MKRTRLNGNRKKRSTYVLFGADEVQTEPITAVEMHTVAVLAAHVLTEPALEEVVQDKHALEAVVQTESVLEDDFLLTDSVLEDGFLLTDSVPAVELHTQPRLDLVVQTEPDGPVGEVQHVKPALGRAVGKPTGCGKKRKSINLLCGVEVEKEKKSVGKKRQKK